MSLLQMSFSGALLILVIVLLRVLALHRLPKMAFLLLWALALLRLLLPYSLPSACSAYSLWARLAPAVEAVQTLSPVENSAAVWVYETAAAPAAAAGTAPAASGLSIAPWRWVWCAGTAVCTVFFALAYRRCRREFRASLPWTTTLSPVGAPQTPTAGCRCGSRTRSRPR